MEKKEKYNVIEILDYFKKRRKNDIKSSIDNENKTKKFIKDCKINEQIEKDVLYIMLADEQRILELQKESLDRINEYIDYFKGKDNE